MRIVNYFRYPNEALGIEVTAKELNQLSNKYSFISISEHDKNNLGDMLSDNIVGIIMGDICSIDEVKNMINDAYGDDRCSPVDNPDCWFVNNEMASGYKEIFKSKFKFGEAIELLKLGYKVAREGWNGKNMWLIYQPTTPAVKLRDNSVYKLAGLDEVQIDGHIDIYTAKGTMQPGWLASQTDILVEDWIVVT